MDIGSLNLYNEYDAAASSATANKLQKVNPEDYANATDDELMSVCKEFEAYFVEQVFKEMQKTIPESESSSGSSSSLVDYFKDQTTQKLASDATEQNGLGLAQMMYEQMKRNYDIPSGSEAE